MNNLLSAYFQRLIKSKLYWCLLGLMILSGIIIPILAHREMIAYLKMGKLYFQTTLLTLMKYKSENCLIGFIQ